MNTADDLLRRALEAWDKDDIVVGLSEEFEEIRAYLDAPKDEPVWIQPDHLQKAKVSPFLCRVEPKQRWDFVPLYLHPPTKTAPMKAATIGMRREAMKHLDGNDEMTMTLRGAFIHGWMEAERHHGITDVRD